MKKLILVFLLLVSLVAHATDLDKIKSIARQLDLVYTGVSDRVGGASYVFYWSSVLHIIVAIPTDLRNDHEAATALKAGFSSAIFTDKQLTAPPSTTP